MNFGYDNTASSSDFHLCPPSPDGQDIFRRTFDSDHSATTNYRRTSSVKYPQNPRKKRTKMLRLDTNSVTISKPKYGKKPDPTAPKITRPCSECGKKFWSWKALFGHMRCHPERQWRGINPPPKFKKPDGSDTNSNGDDLITRMTDEDHHVATCLLMLANGPIACDQTLPTVFAATAITSTNVGLPDSEMGFRDMGGVSGFGDFDGSGTSSNCRFECSSCKKVFGSHQALGGHRASHKNVKGCFAITKNEGEEDVVQEGVVGGGGDHDRNIGGEGRGDANANHNMIMVSGSETCTVLTPFPLGTHQCGICLRVFSSGQALGGHKRCHWEKLGDEPPNVVGVGGSSSINVASFGLDLNLPAPVDDAFSSASYSSSQALDLRLGL